MRSNGLVARKNYRANLDLPKFHNKRSSTANVNSVQELAFFLTLDRVTALFGLEVDDGRPMQFTSAATTLCLNALCMSSHRFYTTPKFPTG